MKGNFTNAFDSLFFKSIIPALGSILQAVYMIQQPHMFQCLLSDFQNNDMYAAIMN